MRRKANRLAFGGPQQNAIFRTLHQQPAGHLAVGGEHAVGRVFLADRGRRVGHREREKIDIGAFIPRQVGPHLASLAKQPVAAAAVFPIQPLSRRSVALIAAGSRGHPLHLGKLLCGRCPHRSPEAMHVCPELIVTVGLQLHEHVWGDHLGGNLKCIDPGNQLLRPGRSAGEHPDRDRPQACA